MRPFQEISIREKLIRVMVAITAAILVPVITLILLIDFFLLRQATVQSLTVLGDAVAFNSAAALAFDDQDDATLMLQAFRADANVTEAILYNLEKDVFASYPPTTEFEDPLPDVTGPWPSIKKGMLHHLTPVWEGENLLGWLLIRYDLKFLQRQLALYLLLTVGLSGMALFLAYFLSNFLQARISRPILALENVARKISEDHDYDIRAVKTTEDEIGALTEAFNEMLDQIASKEAALRISEERLMAAVEASQSGVWDWNLTTGNVVWIGPIYKFVAWQPTGAASSTEKFYSVIHQADRAYVQQKVEEALHGHGVFEADFRLAVASGEDRIIRARGQTLLQDGQAVRMVGAFTDITDLRTAQAEILDLNRNLENHVNERTAELRGALAEIEAFNYSVSHDLRTPLRSINGFSQALLEDYEDQLDATGKDFLNRIVASCRRMDQLIDDLLKLSRITKQEMRKETVNLSALAAEIVDALREEHPERTVDVRIEENLKVEGDPSLLAIALENLLQNAWKFTSKKEQARIEFGKTEEDGETVYFVRDNGAGFDMAFAENLFGVFQRLHKNSEFEGTGIGLATFRRILERHGGTIRATGALDQGATFYFTVPSQKAPL